MSSSPSWSSINRRMRNLDLKLKSENDSNQRCSFDTLILDEEPSLTAKPIATTTASTTTKNVISSTSESSNIGDDSEQSHEIIGVNYDPTFDFCSFESDQCREALVHHQHHHYPSDTTTDYFTENPSISSQESITTQSMIEESSELSVIVPIATSPTTKTTTGNTSGHVAAPLRPTNLPIGPRSAAIKHSQEVSRTLSATGSSNANRSAFARSNFKEPKSAPTPTSSNPLSFTLNQSLRSTYSSFIDRISARINGSFNFGSRPLNSATAPTSSSAASTTGTNYQHLPVFGQGSDPTGRPMTLRSNSAKSNGSTDVPQIDHPPLSASAENAQVGGSPLSLSVNAQCLSPRPRPKARKHFKANYKNDFNWI